MSMRRPNCGHETNTTDRRSHHYPSAENWQARAEWSKHPGQKKAIRFLEWSISIILILVVTSLVFVHFSPDYNIFFIRSESMKPSINMGDTVVTGPIGGPLNGELKPGAIVTYERGDELVTHRVLSVSSDTLMTKGDAMEEPDPWSVTISGVSGIYLFRIPYVGYLTSFIRTKIGWFVAIIVPAVLLVALLIRGIVKEALSAA